MDPALLAFKIKAIAPRGAGQQMEEDHASFWVVVFRRGVGRNCLLRRVRCLGAYGVRSSTVCSSSRDGLSVGKTDSALRARVCWLQVRVVLAAWWRSLRGLLSACGPNPAIKPRAGWFYFKPAWAPAQISVEATTRCGRGLLRGLFLLPLVGPRGALKAQQFVRADRTPLSAYSGHRWA